MIIGALIIPSWRHDPGILISKVAFLRFGNRRLVPWMVFIHWVPERVMGDKGFLVLPVFVIRRTKQNPQPEVDIDQIGGDQLTVHDYPRGDVHRLAPLVHRPVIVVAYIRILERSPAAEKNPPQSDLLVTGKRIVEKVEQIVVERHNSLHKFHIPHQSDEKISKELDGRHGTYSTRIKRRGMHVTSFH